MKNKNMTRKESLQALAAFGLSLSLPLPFLNIFDDTKPLKVITIGHMACDMADYLKENLRWIEQYEFQNRSETIKLRSLWI